MKLQWTPGETAYYLASACGRYTVCKHIGGSPRPYGAWREATPVWIRIGTYENSKQARRAAQEFEDALRNEAGFQRGFDL